MGTNEIVATSPVPRAPGEPAVLARLPEAVEYTYVKMILLSVLSPMYWFPWLDPHATDPTWVRFGRGTFRAVDRILRREEQRLAAASPEVSTQAHDRVRMLRHLFVQHLIQAVRYWDPSCATRWIEIRLVSPPPDPQRPRRFEYREWVLDAWARPRGMPQLLEQVVDTFTSRLAERRTELSKDDGQETEHLRQALRSYRSLFDQLIGA